MGIGERLGALRKKKGLTLRELSENVGITAAALSSYEKGQKEPSLGFAMKLADFYGVSLDELCDRKSGSGPFAINCADIVVFSTKLFSGFGKFNAERYGHAAYGFVNKDGTIQASLELSSDNTRFILDIHRKEISEFFETYSKLVALCDSKQIPHSVLEDWYNQSIERLRKTKLIPESAGEES